MKNLFALERGGTKETKGGEEQGRPAWVASREWENCSWCELFALGTRGRGEKKRKSYYSPGDGYSST